MDFKIRCFLFLYTWLRILAKSLFSHEVGKDGSASLSGDHRQNSTSDLLLLLFTFFFLLALYDLSNLSVLHFWLVLGYVCIWMIQVKMWWKHCYMLYFYCFINGLSNVPSQHWWALLGFVLVCMFWQGNIKPYFSHSKASFGRRVTPSPSAWACFTARYSSRHWPTHAFGGF